VVRRLVFVLVLFLAVLMLGLLLFGGPSGPEYVRAVSPVEVRPMPELPGPSSQEMQNVWDAAVEEDSSPDLATNGKTGTSGDGVALTFDDGPNPRTTPRILDILREHDTRATFFVVGSQVEEHPDLLRQIVEDGNAIGNHTYDHANLSKLSTTQMRNELERTQKAVDKALGYHYEMKMMRPPYGEPYGNGSDALPAFRKVVRQEQLFPVIWTIDTQDYLMADNPRGIVKNVASLDKKGRDQVILMHDIHLQDVRALPGVIDHLERSGRQFVGVDELLRDKYPVP
jgi:peptidoglycan/xylan/chitin deacetylase (PgdA/CDA1 family)